MSDSMYTPSAINKYLKSILESDMYLKSFKLKGEVSNLKYHTNNNIYFSIKDEDASIDCICFSYHIKKNVPKLTEGMKIQVNASLYLYVKAGKYNLNITNFEKIGEGELYHQFLKLKSDLEKKGFFSSELKKEIPIFSSNIGVITSKTSAALQDILATLKLRNKNCHVTVFNTLVQGKNAKYDIVENLKLADSQKFDCIIIGRGGGSIEDLWSFNEPEVVYAAYICSTPLISCVGHETDTTIIDYVADYRAPTPTAAAIKATFELKGYKKQISDYIIAINKLTKTKLDFEKVKLDNLKNSQYLLNPLLSYNLNYDRLKTDFDHEIKKFNTNISTKKNQLEDKSYFMKSLIINKLEKEKVNMKYIHSMIDSLNPLEILSRGYSVSYVNSKPVFDLKNVKINQQLETRVKNGVIVSIVKELNEEI